jgi:hypothetical protein
MFFDKSLYYKELSICNVKLLDFALFPLTKYHRLNLLKNLNFPKMTRFSPVSLNLHKIVSMIRFVL